MTTKVAELTVEEFSELISESVKRGVEDGIEEIMALQSPEFIRSIEEARQDYKEGRVVPLEELLK